MNPPVLIVLHNAFGVILWISDQPAPEDYPTAVGSVVWEWQDSQSDADRMRAAFYDAIELKTPQFMSATARGTAWRSWFYPTTIEVVPVVGIVLSPEDPRLSTLSVREREVLELTASGLSSADTAKTLHITRDTVEKHRHAIRRKLNVHSTVEMALFAFRNGVVDWLPRKPE